MKHTLLLILLLSIVGCSSNNPQHGSPSPSAAETNGRTPWFCQTGTDNDSWECVQSETLAANPKPERLPAPRRPNKPEIPVPQAEFSGSRLSNLPNPLAQDSIIPNPRPTNAANAEAAPTTTAQTPPAVSTNEPPATRPFDPNLPVHVALSYRPKKPVAILDLPENFWAVQLVAVSSKEALEAYARNNKLAGMSAARVWNGKSIYYVLLLGIYETRENAERAIASLGGPLKQLDAWVRSVGSLQKAMLDADREAGTTEI